MALRLKWENKNTLETSVEIYRGTARLDRANLGTPIATLPNGVNEYIDTAVEFDKTYFYVLVVKTPTDRIVSRNYEIKVEERRGAGPNTLQYGNRNLGYYGTIGAGGFINSADLLAAAKSTAGLPTGASFGWHKFARKGKVLFVPDTPVGFVTWDALYKAGMVYGVAGGGPANGHGALAAVDQKTVINWGGDDYLIRLPSGFSEDGSVWDGTVPNLLYSLWPTQKTSEYNDLLACLGRFYLPYCRLRQIGQSVPPFATYISGPTTLDKNGVWCKERSADLCLRRGASTDSGLFYFTDITKGRRTVDYVAAEAPATANRWMPIAELIETAVIVLGGN